MKLTLDTPTQVFFYEPEFYVLSNFSAFAVSVFGREFMTAEHAYQWKKFFPYSTEIAILIQTARSAHDAFKLAQTHKQARDPDWEKGRLEIMKLILWAKVHEHEYVRRKLLETGDRELVENSWRDDFWGWGEDRKGLNCLGKIWMQIRAELRKPS